MLTPRTSLRRLPLASAAGLVAFLALACRTPVPVSRPEPDATWLAGLGDRPGVPPGLESSVVLTSDRSTLSSGDRVTFHLRIDHGGETLERYLVFEVAGLAVEDGTPQVMTVTGSVEGVTTTRVLTGYSVGVELFDEQGERLDGSEVTLADSGGGMHVAACQTCGELGELLRAAGLPFDAVGVAALEDRRPFDRCVEAMQVSAGNLLSLIGLARGDELLADLFWDVFDKPSLLSVVEHRGIDVTLEPEYASAILIAEAPAGFEMPGPFYSLPLTISLNDEPALFADLLVARPGPPLTMTTGILALRGRHPNGEVTVHARLVGARFAPPEG